MMALIAQWRIAAGGCAAAAALALLALWRLEAAHARRLQDQVQAAQAAQRDAQAQAAASGEAASVVAEGAQRDRRAIVIHSENSHAIQTAPGSGETLDPAVNNAGRRGLCSYASYAADPQCFQLSGAGSAGDAQAGSADTVAKR
jgi:hypothetical protein